MKPLRTLGVLTALGSTLILGACDGSSSSGAAAFSGTYTATGTATAGASVPASEALASVIVIEGGGSVTFDPGTPNAFTGTISGNHISAVVAGSRVGSPGLQISCTGAVRVTGEAFNDGIRSGAISSTELICNGIALTLGGDFAGPEVTTPGFPGGRDAPPLLAAIRAAIQTAL